MLPPKFWQTPPGILSHLLSPFGALYHGVTQARLRFCSAMTVAAPVICVGNLSLGGAGKTPTTISLAQQLSSHISDLNIVSRGYKGTQQLPLLVDSAVHGAGRVGDEPLLLAQHCPTWVGKNRDETAAAAVNAGADLLIMDDGYQNPTLHQDFRLLVIDGARGFGNGAVFPAGPLREKFQTGLARAHALLILDPPSDRLKADLDQVPSLPPIFSGTKKLQTKVKMNQAFVAFSGIAYPDRFFDALSAAQYSLVKTVAFRDHHFFTPKELDALQQDAKTLKATLLTTEKDAVRLPESLRSVVETVPLTVELDPKLVPFILEKLKIS